jgi:cellulose synthase/poly-beta-1,6-N-acetylglucosamine synthase-like glycosyltransferase
MLPVLAKFGFTPWAAVWIGLTTLIGLVWLRRHFDLNRGRREPLLCEADARTGPQVWPSLSVVVAARNEEQNVRRCVSGLLAQDYPDLQIIVADDRSEDRTGAILDELSAQDPRLSVVHVRELPPGWFGKNHAMHVAVSRATGQLLCFSDADCTYDSPSLLRAAVAFALRHDVEFLSVLPRLEASGLWEKIVQPVAGAIMVFWFPPQRVNNPASRCAYANGAFMLLTRKAYQAIGGHAYAKATLNEDMHMARRAKELGLRLRVIRGGTLYRVRMYAGFRQIWRGWSRIFYGCFGSLPRLLASAAMLSVFSLSPYVALVAGLALLSPALTAAAGFAVVAQQTVLWRFYRVSGSAPGWALTYPLGAALCLGMTVSAMTRLAGKATDWRGTRYVGGA